MKTYRTNCGCNGLTLIELLVVIAVIAIIAAILMPTHYGPRRAYRIVCMSNLKQIDLGFALYASDYHGKFPMQVSAGEGGTKEFIFTGHTFPHFEKLRKYTGGPNPFNIFVCPTDSTRKATTNVEALSDMNLSYFLNADASANNTNASQIILSGERDLSVNRQPVEAGLLLATTNLDLNWTGEFHPRGGNLAFVDGHVEWNKTNELRSWIQRQPVATNRFCVP